jgi:hypothetical protein
MAHDAGRRFDPVAMHKRRACTGRHARRECAAICPADMICINPD